MSEVAQKTLTELTVTLLAAFVQNNNVRNEDLAGLIISTHSALVTTAGATIAPNVDVMADRGTLSIIEPAVTVRKSLASTAFIISMIDGKPYKSLKRHLSAKGISPDQYRERFNLPATYPMVAPEYSESRRAFARNIGLGRTRADSASVAPETPGAVKTAADNKKVAAGAAAARDPKPRGRSR